MIGSTVVVSVCCITYNQQKYIKKCLDSILMQKTNFQYEIIIYDDASTDETPKILKDYKNRFGDRIKLVLQQKNQWSQGRMVLKDFVFPLVQGKYIAFCEGDDYWTDINKLQKQFDAMEKDRGASWSTHYVQCVNEDGSEILGLTIPPTKEQPESNTVFSSEETIDFIIENGLQMTSYFIRTDLFRNFFIKSPQFITAASPVSDEAIVRYCAAAGEMVFIPNSMSCYRMQAKGSWTSSNENNNLKMANHYHKMIDMIDLFDEYTHNKYSKIIAKDRIDKEWKAAWYAKDYRALMSKKFSSKRKKLALKSRIKLVVLSVVKTLSNILKKPLHE